jgi:hypothetical protein
MFPTFAQRARKDGAPGEVTPVPSCQFRVGSCQFRVIRCQFPVGSSVSSVLGT